jgi:Uncharacterised protein family (UPF0259)
MTDLDLDPGARRVEPGRIISEVFRIYREQAGVLLPVAIVLFGINALVGYFLRDGALALIASIVSLVIATFYQGMVVQLVRDVIDGRRDSSAGDLLRSVSPVVLTLIIVSILAGLATGIGFILLIVPGLYLMTIWSVIAPVVVVERTGVFDSFGRSRALVKGHGWQVFGVIVLVVVLLLVVTIITAILIDAVGDAGGSAISWALNVLTAPITALVAAVLYFALRVAHSEPARPEDAVQWMPPAAPGGAPASSR